MHELMKTKTCVINYAKVCSVRHVYMSMVLFTFRKPTGSSSSNTHSKQNMIPNQIHVIENLLMVLRFKPSGTTEDKMVSVVNKQLICPHLPSCLIS